MRKLIIAIAALVAFTLGACKKEYTCECKKTRTNNSTSVSTDDGNYLFNDSRARAESRCNDQEGSGSDAFGSYTRDCEIR